MFSKCSLARCAWPSDSWGKWKPILCRRAPLVLSVKSYYQCRYASPVTSNPIDAERNCWRLPATRSTVQLLQRSSLMGGLADKGQERWQWWHWWETKRGAERGWMVFGGGGGCWVRMMMENISIWSLARVAVVTVAGERRSSRERRGCELTVDKAATHRKAKWCFIQITTRHSLHWPLVATLSLIVLCFDRVQWPLNCLLPL